MGAPAWTFNAQGNALASGTLAGAGSTTFAVDFSGVMAGQIQVSDTGGVTVAATNGVQISVGRFFTTTNDTIPFLTANIGTVVSTPELESIELSSGKYSVTLKNLDATNSVNVAATTNTLSWPS
jgi:hypothetical protein